MRSAGRRARRTGPEISESTRPTGPHDSRTHDAGTRDTVTRRLRAAGCVFAEDEAAILLDAARSSDQLAQLVRRRCAGEPLEHVVGWVEFCGHRIQVGPGVFVPRTRTELLARTAVAAAGDGDTVLELCCGAGAVASVVAGDGRAGRIVAADVDARAAACARRNLTGAQIYVGDLYDPLPADLRGGVHVLVANAPYVPTASIGLMPREATEHEPAHTRDGGRDGLDVARRVVADAPRWLAPGGILMIETARAQAAALVTEMSAAGLEADVRTDDAIAATVVTGRRPPRRGR